MRTLRTAVTTLAVAALLAAGPSLASAQAGAPVDDDIPPAGALTKEQVTSKLTEAGYTNVRDVEFDDGRWEADATSPSGQDVDLELDPMSGKILKETVD